MLQTHSMILWAKPRKEDFNLSVDKAYSILKTLEEFGTELNPKYLKARRKKDAKVYDGTYETLKELLRKGVNKEGQTVFLDLGYSIGFFSSLVNKDAAGISISVGKTHPDFINTVVVNLPQSLSVHDLLVAEKLIQIFKKCIEIFDPYWGCIGNNINVQRFNGFWKENLPTTIHWVNFFGKDIVNQLGVRKIEQAPIYKTETLGDGYFIRLKENPIKDDSKEDINIQSEMNFYFGFSS